MNVEREISFRVDAVPVAQPRQRHRSMKSKEGKTISHNYTPTRHPVNAFKAAVSERASLVMDGGPMTGHVHVGITVVVSRTKTLTKDTGIRGRIPLSKKLKGDWDNFAKSVCDAMHEIVYDDDCRIYSGFVQKFYAAEDEVPHTIVLVQEHSIEDPHGEQEAPTTQEG